MNLFDYIEPDIGENFTTILEHKNIKIVRIVSSDRFEPIEYLQDEDEWALVVQGEASLKIGDREITLKSGDSIFIPAKTPHKILSMKQHTLWLTIHIF